MEEIFEKREHSIRSFFYMLKRAKLPYLWILGYIILTAVLANVGINVTEYTAELFAGNVGFAAVVLPFLLFSLLSMMVGSISGVASLLCMARIDRGVRRMVWKKTVRLPLEYYDNNKPKELISRITTDVTSVGQLVMQVFVAILTSAYSVWITLSKIGSYDTRLMIALIAVLPLNIVIAVIMGKLHFGVQDLVNQRRADMTQTVAERTDNMLLIKAFGKEKKEFEAGGQKMRELYKGNIFNAWLGFDTPMYAIAGAIQFIVIVLVGRRFYSDGTLTLAQWIAYYGFAMNIVNNLSAYCGYWTTFKTTQGATRRITSLVMEMEEDVEKGDVLKNLEGNIVVEDLSFGYGEKTLFEQLSLRIPEGSVTALVGPSGSGKTTLLNLIERFYQIPQGKVYFGNKDVSAYSLKSFREQIAYVTQEGTLFAGTIKENLLFGVSREVSQEELEDACRAAGILEFILELQEGFEAKVGEGGANLSGGQRQRLALARAFLKQKRYLFMDEATAAMDIQGKDEIWTGIRKYMSGSTVLMVAHDKQTVLKADYIIVLQDGKITAQGSRTEVAKTSAYYRKVIGGEE